MSVVVFQHKRVLHNFEQRQMVWSWMFLEGGKQVAAVFGPTHGPEVGDITVNPQKPFGVLQMRIGSIVVRCYEFDKMLAFWQEALRYVPREPAKGGWVVLRDPKGRGPNLSLDQYPTKRSGKRSRLHLDLYTSNKDGEVERLVKLGATRYRWRYRPHDDFIVLEDPDGNLFCVVQVASETKESGN